MAACSGLVLGLSAVLLCGTPGIAVGFEFATDTGDASGNQLRWTQGEPIHFTQHVDGEGSIPAWVLHAEARIAFQSWASAPESDISFVEDAVFGGPACPHALPEEASPEDSCGGGLPPHDFRSALFFIETVWPFGEEVIALTTLSWQEGGGLVDADISFNAVDYDWTVDPDAAVVDYQSITLHEVGHFLGLAHSAEPDAVMRVDYEEGDLARQLGADDRAGVAEIYPCMAEPCVGGIEVETSSCAFADAAASRALVGLILCAGLLLLVRRERNRRAALPLLLFAIAVLVPTAPRSSTVVALDVGVLAERSDRVVRATVESVESWRDGIVWTRIRLRVDESWRGQGPERVELVQPGGTVAGFGTKVFGIPEFSIGEDVVVFLKDSRVYGLAQGKFTVAASGALRRDTSELGLARVGTFHAPGPLRAPASVEALRDSVVLDDL